MTTPTTTTPSQVDVAVTVNGEVRRVSVPARLTLADLLRDRLGLTGTHLGCEHGVCGACTVFLDGRSVRACLTLAVQADGAEVTTVEGLDEHPTTEQLRTSFRRHHALQCGFCTPGMLVTATELVDATGGPPTPQEVRETMSGNICRCTGYQGIVQAVLEAAAARSTAPRPPHPAEPQPEEK